MTRRPPIEGQVARILNLRELAINRGTSHGVVEGMVFDVLDPKSEDIADPESGEVLGSVYRPKVQVRVFAVEERLSLARTFRSQRVNLGGSGLALARAFEPPKWVEEHETLRTSESTWEDLDESESIVKTGDPVVEAISSAGTVEETGSRTLDHPEAALQLEVLFADWLTKEGWVVQKEEVAHDTGLDIIASREGERLLAEVKWRRRPLALNDLAQAFGLLALSASEGDENQRRNVLVVGPAGVTSEALHRVTKGPENLEIYRATEEGSFEPLTEIKALGSGESRDAETA